MGELEVDYCISCMYACVRHSLSVLLLPWEWHVVVSLVCLVCMWRRCGEKTGSGCEIHVRAVTRAYPGLEHRATLFPSSQTPLQLVFSSLSLTMATTSTLELPTLALPHPYVLLPSARITLPVTSTLADALIRLVDSASENGQSPILAAIPLLPPQHSQNSQTNSQSGKLEAPKLNEWGVLARVIRLVRSQTTLQTQRSSSSSPYLLALQGLSRVRLLDSDSASKSLLKRDPLPLLAYERTALASSQNRALVRIGDDAQGDTQDGELPSMEEFVSFKNAALRMLERLSQDATQRSRREGWVKVMGLVEDLEEGRAGWMADMLVSTVRVEYADKIGELFCCFFF